MEFILSQGNSDFGAGHLNIDYNVKKAPECDGTIRFSPSGVIFEISENFRFSYIFPKKLP